MVQLDLSYLLKGLTALENSRHAPTLCNWSNSNDHWVMGHEGAAVIAAYFFCSENSLEERTVIAVKDSIDKFIAKKVKLFTAEENQEVGDERNLNSIVEVLDATLTSFCGMGHNVIYAALALKALKKIPQAATPRMTSAIARLIRIVGEASPISTQAEQEGNNIPIFDNEKSMVALALSEFLKFKNIYYRSQNNIGHLITHTQALLILGEIGYTQVAKNGYLAHRLHAHTLKVGHEFENREMTLADPISSPLYFEYWQEVLQNDYWKSTHTYKFSYQFYDFLKKIPDGSDKVNAIKQMSFLLRDDNKKNMADYNRGLKGWS